MEAHDILTRLDRIGDLPTLSPVAARVNRMLQDPDTSIRKLSETIEKDQPITARMLKLVNSAFFGMPSRVGNIPHALVLLGFNTVRNAVLSISIINAFSPKKILDGFDMKEFWRHSIAVAVTSKHLAEKTRLHPPDDSFTGGLLHYIGKFVLSQYFPDLFGKVWTSSKENHLSFIEAEKREMPLTHAQIGAHLASKWRLPAGLTDSIRYHHAVKKSVEQPGLMMIINAADGIVNEFIHGSNGSRLAAIHPDARVAMGQALEKVSDWFPGVLEEIESACIFFLKE